jgi:Bacterial conjugation TrbI-like protein
MESQTTGIEKNPTVKLDTDSPSVGSVTDVEETGPGGFESLRALLDKVRQSQKPVASRRELSRDKSKSLFLLVGVSVALLLVFLGLFSSPKGGTTSSGKLRGAPNLGRKVTPGQGQNDPAKASTPILSADLRQSQTGVSSDVTPEEVGRTSPHYQPFDQSPTPTAAAPAKPPAGKEKSPDKYALRQIDFSDPAAQVGNIPNPPRLSSPEADAQLKKPSLVFVRAAQNARPAVSVLRDEPSGLLLPAGTRLVARLEAPVSSAVPAPVIAVIEYSYEHDGEIVLPAGTRVLGKLSHVTSSGFVGLQFDRVETPDGGVQRIDATAMDLKFGPLKGNVSGRNRGKNFLVRSLTGIGTVAAYMVGGQGTTGFNGPISENSLLRERLASNIGIAGQDEINTLAANQTLVVTVPGNTRFYVVVEKGSSDQQPGSPGTRPAENPGVGIPPGKVPTLDELRELMQLRNELNQMYLQTGSEAAQAQN